MDLLHFKDSTSNRDVISLFSGAMGLDIGLAKAGLNVVVGQDFDPACVATMRANGHRVLSGDIREIDEADLLDLAGLAQGEPFLVCGGPPCQPFSTAGKRLGINDPRGSLFMDFIRMIDYIRPRFFIMENVKGLMSAPLKHTPLAERDKNDPAQQSGTVLDVILSEFNKLGYKTVYGVYENGWYDGCAVMIRRLLETLIVEVFENYKIATKIQNPNGDFYYLSDLISCTLSETSWNLSRNSRQSMPKLKTVGDLSAHSRRYNAHKSDIDNIIPDLRVVVQELLYLAGLK